MCILYIFNRETRYLAISLDHLIVPLRHHPVEEVIHGDVEHGHKHVEAEEELCSQTVGVPEVVVIRVAFKREDLMELVDRKKDTARDDAPKEEGAAQEEAHTSKHLHLVLVELPLL